MLSCPYLFKKTSILSKSLFSDVIFSNFSWKTQSCHAHIWWKKNINFLNTTLCYGLKKSMGCPLLFRFLTKKSLLACPYLVKKNVHSLNNTLLSCSVFSPWHLKVTATFLSVVVTTCQIWRLRVRFLLRVIWNSIYIWILLIFICANIICDDRQADRHTHTHTHIQKTLMT